MCWFQLTAADHNHYEIPRRLNEHGRFSSGLPGLGILGGCCRGFVRAIGYSVLSTSQLLYSPGPVLPSFQVPSRNQGDSLCFIVWAFVWQIRNVATLGGNIVTASPISDMVPVLIAAGATLRIASLENSRTLLAAAFFKGYRKVDLLPGEVLLSIFVQW